MVITLAFQAWDVGSIPITCSTVLTEQMPVHSPSLAQAELNLRCDYGREEVLNYSFVRHAGVAQLVER